MTKKLSEQELLVRNIAALKRSTCPRTFRYAHEFLDLAILAARREAPSDHRAGTEERRTETREPSGTVVLH